MSLYTEIKKFVGKANFLTEIHNQIEPFDR